MKFFKIDKTKSHYSEEEIKQIAYSIPFLTLKRISEITKVSIEELKQILSIKE